MVETIIRRTWTTDEHGQNVMRYWSDFAPRTLVEWLGSDRVREVISLTRYIEQLPATYQEAFFQSIEESVARRKGSRPAWGDSRNLAAFVGLVLGLAEAIRYLLALLALVRFVHTRQVQALDRPPDLPRILSPGGQTSVFIPLN